MKLMIYIQQIFTRVENFLQRRFKVVAALLLGILIVSFGLMVRRYRNVSQSQTKSEKQSGPIKVGDPLGSRAESREIFQVKKVHFKDEVQGLVGTIKGKTLELKFPGNDETLLKVNVEVGDRVEKNSILFELDHVKQESKRKQAQIAFDRTQDLFTIGSATQRDLDEALAELRIAAREYEQTFIRAPSYGAITEVNKRQGETLSRNETVGVFVQLNEPLYIETGVVENHLAKLKEGLNVLSDIPALGVKDATGTITAISQEVTTSARNALVHISLPTHFQPRLRPGISSISRVLIVDKPGTLVVPAKAFNAETSQVYVWQEEALSAQSVVVGAESLEYIEILEGLNEGDKIAADIISEPIGEASKVVMRGELLEYKEIE